MSTENVSLVMAGTRASIRLERREGEIEKVDRNRPDPVQVERDANKRKRLQNAPPESSPPPKRKQSTRPKKSSRGEKIALPSVISEALRAFRKHKTHQRWLSHKLRKIESMRDRRRRLLAASVLRQIDGELDFDKGLEVFAPQTDRQRRACRSYFRLGVLLDCAEREMSNVEDHLWRPSQMLGNYMLEQHGFQVSSDEQASNSFEGSEDYSLRSSEHDLDEEGFGSRAKSHTESGAEHRHRQMQEQVKSSGQEPGLPCESKSRPRSLVGPEVQLESTYEEANRPEISQRVRDHQLEALRARRRARERLHNEYQTFDKFWLSYGVYKNEWERQRKNGETDDSFSELGRMYMLRGRDHTRDLIGAEQNYRAAAWDAKNLKLEILSTNQTSIFPSDDGIDQEALDCDAEDIERQLDRRGIADWIQEEWQYGDPSAFDSPDARPIQKNGEALAPLPQVPFGLCEEDSALDRRRAHIDKWGKWSHADWQAMLQDWPVQSSNRQGVPVSPPPDCPKPDLLRFETDEEGAEEERN